MPRAAGDGKFYQVGIVPVQDYCCPSCGEKDPDWLQTANIKVQDQYVSVTSVINATLPKDGLVGWAANIAVDGMLDLAQNKGWDLSDPGMTPELAKSLLQEFGFTSYGKRDEKGETGTRIHNVLEAYGQAFLATQRFMDALDASKQAYEQLPEEEKGYGRAVCLWLEERAPKPILVEEPMACHHHGVAGTGDLYWETTGPVDYQRLTEVRKLVSWEIQIPQGARVLTDLKTSKTFRESHFIQVAFYGDHMIQKDLGLPVDHKTVLRVNPDGTWEEKEAVGWSDDVFLALLDVYRLMKGDKGGS